MSAHSLPPKWSRRRLRFSVQANPVKSELRLPGATEVSFVPMEAIGEYGGLRLDEVRSLEDVYTGYTYFRDGDVCIAKITPCFENGKGALAHGLTNGIGFGTTELHVLRPGPTVDGRFLFYVSIAHDFRSNGEPEMLGAGGQKRIPERYVKDWLAPLPSLDTQKRIADYLDEKTEQIDSLISRKRLLLDKLTEKRQAIISHAVTKGLNPAAPKKGSGIEWLGTVPAHWEIVPLKRVIELQRGHDLPQQDRGNGSVLLISSAGEIGRHDIAIADAPGIVTGRYGTIGEFYLINSPYWPLNTTLYSKRIMGDAAFVWRLLQVMKPIFVLNSLKSAVPGVDRNDVADEHVARPPITEQTQIAEHIDRELRKLSSISEAIHNSCDQLTEYRSALITEAVTGKVEALQ